jgi:hypothetical protein
MEIAKGFRGSGRYRGLVRAARAYFAGFGTTGSLLAGAALMFIVASALVAFRGWPHLAPAPAPGEVVIAPRSARSPGASAFARRLAAVVAAPAAGTGPAAAPGAGRRGGTGGRRGVGPTGPTHSVGAPVSTSIPVGTPAATPTSSCATGGCGPATTTTAAPPPTPVQQGQQLIQQVTNTLGKMVSGTGGQVGSTVQQTTSSVAGAVGGASPAVGGVVKQAGSGTAKTVTGVTNAVGGLVSGLGGR